jgi:predicted peptidase
MMERTERTALNPSRIALAFLFLCVSPFGADDPAAPFTRDEYKPPGTGFGWGAKQTLPYALFVPKTTPHVRYPLILWLDDDTPSLNKLRHRPGGTPQISGSNRWGARLWVEPQVQASHPCFVVAPERAGPLSFSGGAMWENPPNIFDDYNPEGGPSVRLGESVDLILHLASRYPIDTRRIYIVGQGGGATGLWDLLDNEAELFAGGIAASGRLPSGLLDEAGDPRTRGKFASTPVWIFHCGQDRTVSAFQTLELATDLFRAGAAPRVTEVPNTGHDDACWQHIFTAVPELAPWLFSQQRR